MSIFYKAAFPFFLCNGNSNGCEMCERKIKSRQHRYDTKMYVFGDENFMRVEKISSNLISLEATCVE